MKNSMIHKNIASALTGIFFVSVLSVGTLGLVPTFAQAQEYDTSGGCCGGSDSIGIDLSSPASYGSDAYGVNYTSPASYGSDAYGVNYTSSALSGSDAYGINYASPASYGSDAYGINYSSPASYSTPSYSTSGYSTGGYSTSGYSTGGYSTGGGYVLPAPHYSTPTYSAPASNVYAPTNVNTNVNNNTCTGNSCNTTITNPAPVINNVVTYPPAQAPVQYCASGYYGTYPNCYRNQPVVYQPAPVAYNAATPYISLSQIPYTGLDLGFWGTIAYWGFMIVFALVVAYFIAIKRIQNRIARSMKHFLFGSEDEEVAVTAHAYAPFAHATPAVQNPLPAQTNEDVVDSFILSQINRPRRA